MKVSFSSDLGEPCSAEFAKVRKPSRSFEERHAAGAKDVEMLCYASSLESCEFETNWDRGIGAEEAIQEASKRKEGLRELKSMIRTRLRQCGQFPWSPTATASTNDLRPRPRA